MDKLDILRSKVREHPVFSGGDPDEAFLLDWMEFMLSICGERTNVIVELLASHLEQHPERLPTFIEKSQKDPLTWEALQILVRRLDAQPLKISEEDEEKWEAGRDALNRWARDVATETLTKRAPRGRRAMMQGLRNGIIISAMEGIRACSGKPLFDDYDETRSVAYAVAQRLGMPYATVRRIWKKDSPSLRPLRKMGLSVPFPKGLRVSLIHADPSKKRKPLKL